jgi:lipid-A-disaccharide synthase
MNSSISSTTHHLEAPTSTTVDLLIVAAEHSGDEHAARMVRELLAQQPGLRVCALGGPRLAAAGAHLLRDLTANSADIVQWVGRYQPRAVCFVDSSGLNLRIAQGLCEQGFSVKGGGPTKALYYISPQIWASRAARRFQMSRHLDGLAAIFPFEPACYSDTRLPVQFVGHPFVAADYAAPVAYDPAGPVLLLPGSRRSVVERIFPVLLEAYRRSGPAREAVVLYPSEEILTVLQAANPPANVRLQSIVGGRAQPQAAAAVLTASGTMSMHCALAGIPGALTYRTDPLTYLLGRLLVRVEFIGIANLLLAEAMYPEFIQRAATPAALSAQLGECLSNPDRIARSALQSARLKAMLSVNAHGTAADWLAGHLATS